MKGSDIGYLLNQPVRIKDAIPISSLAAALPDLPTGIVTKIEEGFIEVTPVDSRGKRKTGSIQIINIDQVQRIIEKHEGDFKFYIILLN